MIAYKYKGLSGSGAPLEGVVEAIDEADAIVRARANCSVLLGVEPVSKGKVADIMNMDIGAMFSGGKVEPKKLALICSQFSIELRAGLPLVSSIRLAAENESDKRLKKMLEEVADEVQAGNTLSDAFTNRGPYLPKTFIETIRAGEESGHLDESFARLQKYYENSAEVKSKAGSALVYPIVLIVVAVLVVAIIMIKAVPVFEQSFGSVDTLPGPTRALIGLSHFFTDNILIIIVFLVVIIIGVSVFKKTETGSRLFASWALNFPGLGIVNRMNAASQFASTLGTMLASGLPLLRSARITAEVCDNILVGDAVSVAADGVVEGKRLTEGLRESEYLPRLLVEMTAVGEETGNLEETLSVISEYYSKEVGVAVTRALGILEPAIVLVMAGMVVFILLSVYLPLFSMYGSM